MGPGWAPPTLAAMVAGDIRGRGASSPLGPRVPPLVGPGSLSRRSSTRSFLRCTEVPEGCSWGPALVQSCGVWQAGQGDSWPCCPQPMGPFNGVEAQGVQVCEGPSAQIPWPRPEPGGGVWLLCPTRPRGRTGSPRRERCGCVGRGCGVLWLNLGLPGVLAPCWQGTA